MAEEAKETSYTIGGRMFRIEPLTIRQEEWLREHVLGDLDIVEMDDFDWKDLFTRTIALFLAIALVEEGQTRQQKAAAGFAAVRELESFLATASTPAELMGIVPDFFVVNPPANLWLLVNFKRTGGRAANTLTSSANKSVSLPTET